MLLFLKATALFAQANFSDTSAHAFLSVYSLNDGLLVLINGKQIGATPLRKFPLLAGKYEVAVRDIETTSWLDEDWREHVTVRAGDTLALVARMVKGYRINSVPYGAEVWHKGKLLGTTPYVFRLAENQAALLELRKTAYRSASVQLGRQTDWPRQTRSFEIILERDFDYAALQQQETVHRRALAGKYRKLTYLSAAISLASGVGSVLLKREADEAYDQYLVTGDPVLREQYIARAEKYDRYYSATFAAFEVSFALSFYSFLKSLKK